MGFNDPKYAVKNPSPGFSETFGAFSAGDYFKVAAITAGSSVFGYITGKPVRPQNAATAGIIGATAGFMYAYQNAYGRLMGYSQ